VPVDPCLVADFVAWSRLGRAASDEVLLAGAWNRATDLAARSPEDAWELALAVLRETDEAHVAVDVGINILEDLMSDHAARFIDRLELACFSDPKMALAISSMWNEAHPVDVRFRALVWRAADRVRFDDRYVPLPSKEPA
jgi:hypothetical protein